MTVCAVKSCKNYTSKKDSCPNITFHKFPTDSVIANSWTEIIRRSRNESYWKPKDKTSICSAHFHSKDTYTTKNGRRRIRPGAVPSKALYISSTMSEDDSDDTKEKTNNANNVSTDTMMKEHKDQELSEQNLCAPSTSTGRIKRTSKLLKTNPEENEEAPYISSTTSDDDSDDTEEETNNAANVSIDIITKEHKDQKLSEQNLCEPSISTNTNPEEEAEVIFDSDYDEMFYTPSEVKMRKELRKKTALQIKHTKKIKQLQQKNRRLKKRNASLKQIIRILKKQRFIDKDVYNLLEKKSLAADFYSSLYKKHIKKKKKNGICQNI